MGVRVQNDEHDTKQKKTKTNGLRAIKVPTACVLGPGYATLWKGFRGPRSTLGRYFGRVLGSLEGSQGVHRAP